MSTAGSQVEIPQESPAWTRPRAASASGAPTAPATHPTAEHLAAHAAPMHVGLERPPAPPWAMLELAAIAIVPLLLISYVFWDRALLQWARALGETKPPWAVALGWASHGTVLIAALITIIAVSIRTGGVRVWRWALLALVSFFASGLSCSLIKYMVGRYRPSRLTEGFYGFEPFSIGYDFNGFPSGHAVALGALMGIAILARPRLTAVWIALAAAWSSARLFTLSHYASDVIFGLFFGCAWSFLIYSLAIRRPWWTRQFDPAR